MYLHQSAPTPDAKRDKSGFSPFKLRFSSSDKKKDKPDKAPPVSKSSPIASQEVSGHEHVDNPIGKWLQEFAYILLL